MKKARDLRDSIVSKIWEERAFPVPSSLCLSCDVFQRLPNKISFHNDLRIKSICQIIVKTSFVLYSSFMCVERWLLLSTTCLQGNKIDKFSCALSYSELLAVSET